ncbi:MAG TPA: 4Fe-4S binding protein [Spirochaetota bacterium]|nr:4Fe-4S binding protein [Spirochaetota bacterium]
MGNDAYELLANVLGSLPNGFPRTETGVELELLKKLFAPDEAELFCRLRLNKETAREIAERTGLEKSALETKLARMWERGLVECDPSGAERKYGLVAWILGLYELQQKFIDEEFARLHAKYIKAVGPYFLRHKPHMMQVVPIEKEIRSDQSAMPYERVSALIDSCVSFAVSPCICKKQTSLLGRECRKPREVCLAISEKEGYFDNHPLVGRVITKTEALDILRMAEDAGLVHMTGNTKRGHFFICNCCGCCCVQLMAARFGMRDTVNAHYYAVIDNALCRNCGLCSDTRCQVKAIATEGKRTVMRDRCIGCGLCVSTCPEKAITLFRKSPEEQQNPPEDESEWNREKARAQGIDITPYE